MILDEVAKLLADNTTTLVQATNLFKGFEHNRTQDTATFLHEFQGTPPVRVFASSTPAYEMPSIQIVDRSSDYQIGRASSELNYKIMQGQANVVLKPSSSASGTLYLTIDAIQSPFYLGLDKNDRHTFACNYRILKSLST